MMFLSRKVVAGSHGSAGNRSPLMMIIAQGVSGKQQSLLTSAAALRKGHNGSTSLALTSAPFCPGLTNPENRLLSAPARPAAAFAQALRARLPTELARLGDR